MTDRAYLYSRCNSVNVFYREVRPLEETQPGETVFLIGWSHWRTDSHGQRLYAVVGGINEMKLLLDYWNFISDDWKYTLIN